MACEPRENQMLNEFILKLTRRRTVLFSSFMMCAESWTLNSEHIIKCWNNCCVQKAFSPLRGVGNCDGFELKFNDYYQSSDADANGALLCHIHLY